MGSRSHISVLSAGPYGVQQPVAIHPRQIASETNVHINIDELFDPAMLEQFGQPGKPAYSYATLMTYAILTSPARKMSLNEVYTWLTSNFPYFRSAGLGWKNSVRHNLSLNKLFVKVPRPISEPGKGCFWSLDIGALYADPTLTRRLPASRMSPEQEMLDSAIEGAVKDEPAGGSAGEAQPEPKSQPTSASKKRRRSNEGGASRSTKAEKLAASAPAGTAPAAELVGSRPAPTHLRAPAQPIGLSMHFVGGPQSALASQPIYYITSTSYFQRPGEVTPPTEASTPCGGSPVASAPPALSFLYASGGKTIITPAAKRARTGSEVSLIPLGLPNSTAQHL